jgi:hypothetical protein
MLFIEDWSSGKAHIAATLLVLLALLAGLVIVGKRLRAAVWTLCAFVSVVYFGYINETRHYLPLIAFWFAYAWPRDVASANRRPARHSP